MAKVKKLYKTDNLGLGINKVKVPMMPKEMDKIHNQIHKPVSKTTKK